LSIPESPVVLVADTASSSASPSVVRPDSNPDTPSPSLAPAKAVSSAGGRLWEIDAVRGLMLVLMTSTHLSTVLSNPTGQPFGFVSAAEGFVMLSAFMAGMVYSQRAMRDGIVAMRSAFLNRAMKIYGCQAALLLFLFTFVAVLGLTVEQPAVTDLMAYYLHQPFTAFVGGLLLMYNPPLLDILPIYVLFMLISPPILAYGLRHGWNGTLCVSITIWFFAQFGLGESGYEIMQSITGMPIPYRESGSFEMFGWQLLWVLGLWMGATASVARAHEERAFPPFPKWMLATAICLALFFLAWRHIIGQVPFPKFDSQDWHNRLFDKWHLGPLRVIDFFCLLIITMRFGPVWAAAMPRLKWLEMLGSASLPVFCAQLVVVLLALAVFGGWTPERPIWVDVAILTISFALLFVVAWISQQLDRYSAAFKKRRAASKRARAERKALLQPSKPDAG
jgi:hypothetical protein